MSLFSESFYTEDFDQEMLDWIKGNLKVSNPQFEWDISHTKLEYNSDRRIDYFWTGNAGTDVRKLTKQQFKKKINMPDTKQFTKADLKDGMVVTLRDGRQGVVFGESIERTFDDIRSIGENNSLNLISFYAQDLTIKNHSIFDPKGFEIDKVEYMGETIWQREPEENPKQKQLDELYKQIDELKTKADMIKGG